MFAKMGLAMPDGSFYIRNGPVGASDLDNAIKAVGRGEQDGTSGDAIRKHIMKRAAALKLTDKIPDTWNPDGSLKHDWIGEVEDYLEHHGVKGMQWRSTVARQAAQAQAEAAHKAHVAHMAHLKVKLHVAHTKHLEHVAHLKVLAKKAHVAHMGHLAVLKAKAPESQKAAIQKLQDNAANILKSVTAKPSAASHDAFDEEFLEHFGVKGMHWGVRRSRGAVSDHPASPDAVRAKATADTIKKHGLAAVSTADLQHLVSRQNLEKQHGSLNPEHVNAGRKAVTDLVLQIGKQEAGKLASKAVSEGLKKLVEAKS
jgi:hypothetical protein